MLKGTQNDLFCLELTHLSGSSQGSSLMMSSLSFPGLVLCSPIRNVTKWKGGGSNSGQKITAL